jgi:zinc protease
MEEAKKFASVEYGPERDTSYNIVSPVVRDSGTVISKVSEMGVTRLILSNGMKVLLRPSLPSTERGNDQSILVHGFSKSGAGYYSGDDYFNALASAEVVGQSGIGNLDYFGLKKFLANRGISISPYVSDFVSGIKGSSNEENIERLLSMMRELFVNPTRNESAFHHWRNGQLRNVSMKTPDNILRDTIERFTREDRLGFDRKSLMGISFDRSFKIFSEIFGAPDDFVFVITGDFYLDRMIPVVTKYLSSIPPDENFKKRKNVDSFVFLEDSVTRTISGTVEASFVELRLPGRIDFTIDNISMLDALEHVLYRKLTDRLRNRERGVYSVLAHFTFLKYPVSRFVLSVGFKCSAERTEDLIKAVLEEIQEFSLSGVESEFVDNYVARSVGRIKEQKNDKKYWYHALYITSYNDFDIFDFFAGAERRITKVSAESLRQFTSQYIDVRKVMKFVLKPGTKGIINE